MQALTDYNTAKIAIAEQFGMDHLHYTVDDMTDCYWVRYKRSVGWWDGGLTLDVIKADDPYYYEDCSATDIESKCGGYVCLRIESNGSPYYAVFDKAKKLDS